MGVTGGVIYLLVAIALLLAVRHAMVLCQEWTHGTAAWVSEYKDSPFDSYFGGRDAFFLWENAPGVQTRVTFSAVLGVMMYFFCDRSCLCPQFGRDNAVWYSKVTHRRAG